MSNARTLANTINSSSQIVVPSGGIQFADATNANTVANESNLIEQDGYETGSWTPSPTGGSISGTSIVYTGKYTLIGNQLTLYMQAASSSDNLDVSSYVAFSGVPFTIINAGTGTVITEDIDVFSRQGFSILETTQKIFFSPCGSSSGTTLLRTTITTII